jgi:uncharacterized damage-inducible protein DinB
MQAASVVRNWQIEQLQKNIKIIGRVVRGVTQQDASTYRDNGEGWTVLEVMCHLRDFEQLFLDRACMTVEQDTPDLPFPNPNEVAAQGNYMAQNLEAAYAEWVHRRESQLAYFASLKEDAWERTATHPVRGSVSLTDQMMLTVWHDNNHLEQMTKIIDEKKV